MTIGIVIPVFNKLSYTKECLESLSTTIESDVRVVLVNNASSDGTREYLDSLDWIEVIHNEDNLGCAPAWNQGIHYLDSDWTVVLNNDTVLTDGWLDGLLSMAEQKGLGIVSPAIREGELNYPLHDHAKRYRSKMGTQLRMGVANGVCFAVHHSVFDQIGYFDENYIIATYEDTDFWWRASRSGIRYAITGSSFIHHYGGVTQKDHRRRGCPAHEIHNRLYFREKWNMHWGRRRWERLCRRNRWRFCVLRELIGGGHSLNERYRDGKLQHR